ncbi:MAG: DrmE family protein [Clostridia bacterium]|nr:DrmE family protein [Clostridia bacterium]
MIKTKDILQKINVIYDGVELNKIKALNEYADFLCEVVDSDEKHTTAITLNTGSPYYQAMAIAVVVLRCLFYHNTDVEEMIESLRAGDMLMIDGKRAIFHGIKSGEQLGKGAVRDVDYFFYELDGGKLNYLPIEKAKDKDISIYQGTAEKLGSKGVKTTLKTRKEFLSAFLKKENVTTKINHSVAFVTDRDTAEQLYKNIYFNYENKRVALSDIVTANYYSENESYQIGNNPTKEEAIIKFYSKISACRDAVKGDSEKRIIGCFIGDEGVWVENSETHDIADRRGLKFVILAGKTNYTYYENWYESDDYIFYAQVPETTKNLVDDAELASKTPSLEKDLSSFANHEINDVEVDCGIESDKVFEIKRKLLNIKKEGFEGQKRDDFIITSYFLLNLCRSAFFPLRYCDKAKEKNFINWTIDEKLESMRDYTATLIGKMREDAQYIFENISHMVLAIYDTNPKSDILKDKIIAGRYDCIVIPKAYYEQMHLLWLNDCKIKNRSRIVTISTFQKSKAIYNDVCFSTAYYDFDFNPYASFNYTQAEVLLYEYEKYQEKYLRKRVESGRKIIQKKNSIRYEILAEPEQNSVPQLIEDATFENEMDKFAKELLLKNASRYVSSSNNSGDGMVKVCKIFTFASGCFGYFTKYYKGYKLCGEEVREVDLDELNVGDSIVFTKQSENKDIVDLLLNQLLEKQYKNTQYPEHYSRSVRWKEELRKYRSDHDLTHKELVDKLSQEGCSKHYATIRAWLDKDSHIVGPRDVEDYQAIIRLVGLDERAETVKKSCEEIRSLRMKILSLLGKAIINGMFADKKDSVSQLIYERAENLTQIEQITAINDLGENASAPIFMVNKPFSE